MSYHLHQGVKIKAYSIGTKRTWIRRRYPTYKRLGTYCPICGFTPNNRANDISSRAKAAIERLKGS